MQADKVRTGSLSQPVSAEAHQWPFSLLPPAVASPTLKIAAPHRSAKLIRDCSSGGGNSPEGLTAPPLAAVINRMGGCRPGPRSGLPPCIRVAAAAAPRNSGAGECRDGGGGGGGRGAVVGRMPSAAARRVTARGAPNWACAAPSLSPVLVLAVGLRRSGARRRGGV
ncbi:hypothetical protein Vretifemale_4703 [Volvox reticuliferus]|uniref:Uncharacterized protein n=1 Tax=Volvox reticuliferus TaxID=1737510 RepID=A0A8J4C4U5_9CHLO|nr:hypothetical protein Vretifemale_4703 [Volvox reticuliferus]